MIDIKFLGLLILIFVALVLFSKNDFKNWKNLNGLDKFSVLRAPLLCFLIIIILIIKIINEW